MNSPYWFELAVMFGLTALGGVLLAPFAARTSKARRVAKLLLGGAAGVLISAAFGRGWFFAALGAVGVAILIVHAWWLPRHGVNGWTGEPVARKRGSRGSTPG